MAGPLLNFCKAQGVRRRDQNLDDGFEILSLVKGRTKLYRPKLLAAWDYKSNWTAIYRFIMETKQLFRKIPPKPPQGGWNIACLRPWKSALQALKICITVIPDRQKCGHLNTAFYGCHVQVTLFQTDKISFHLILVRNNDWRVCWAASGGEELLSLPPALFWIFGAITSLDWARISSESPPRESLSFFTWGEALQIHHLHMWGINSPSSLPPSPPSTWGGSRPPGRLHHLPRVQLLQQPEQGGRLTDPAELYAGGLQIFFIIS